MSKRGMDSQGGEERYGAMEGQSNDAGVDKPTTATAAQLARRKILSAKGRGTPRGARAGSPAVAAPPAVNPFQQQSFQAFQPQQSSFEFSVPGSTPAPTFGAAPQQNGGMFGAQPNNTPSFNGFGASQANGTPAPSFGSNASAQPQTNGFAPSASFAGFGQSQNTTATPASSFTFEQTPSQGQEQPKSNPFATPASNPFAGLGTQQPQQNGTSFGQGQQEATPKPSAPIFSFGQSQTNSEKPATTGLFGASTVAPQVNSTTSASAPTGLFGSQPAAAASAPKQGESIFSGLNSGSSTLKPNMFSSQQPSRSPSPFEEPQQNGTTTPKPTTNPFANFSSQPKTNGEQPSQSSNSLFAAPKHAQANGESTPKPATSFTGFNFGQAKQQETEKSGEDEGAPQKKPEFTFGQTASKPEQTPKTNMFSQTPSQAPATSPFKFNASQQEDTSMVTPGNTPQKPLFSQPLNLFNTAAEQSEEPTSHHEPAESSTPSNAGKSMFDRISREPAASPNKPLFSFSTPNGSTSVQREEPTPSVTGKSLFNRTTPRDSEPQSQPSASAPAISFGRPNSSTTPFQQDATSSAMPSQPTPTQAAKSSQPLFYASTPAPAAPADRKKLKLLNEGLMSHLKTQDPNKDWTVLFQYYIQQAAKVMGSEAVKMPTPAGQPAVAALKASMPQPAASGQYTTNELKAPMTPSNLSASSTGKFGIMQYPPQEKDSSVVKTPSANNIFSQASQPPATAPVNRKRSADGNIAAPATEQRAKPDVTYPKLPETASNTAKLFASTLDKQKASASTFTPSTNGEASNVFKPSTKFNFRASTPARNAGETSETPAPSFKPTPAKPAETSEAPAFGFKPAAPASSSSSTSGFKPSFGATPAAGASSFLSAFGKKADATLEEAKRKRMDEDYDSDEDDKASWEAKDKAEQEAKRRKIEEAAKSASGFKIPMSGSSASTGPFTFKVPGATEAPAQQDKSPNLNAGKSMFDRISPVDKTPAPTATPSLFSVSTSNPTPTSNLFSPKPGLSSGFKFGAPTPAKDATTAEKQQGSGIKAWTPNTPIKFGGPPAATESTTPAAPPPAFSNLFGASKTSAQNGETGKLAPPAVGFSFGAPKGVSADVSRATTPGVTTDGETSVAGDNAEGEPSDQQNDEQVEDMTALMPAERADEDLLFEVAIAKAQKLDQKQDDNGNNVSEFVDRGKGPLYILKKKDTGKVRVVMKIPPLGRLAMNFSPQPGLNYTCAPGRKVMTAAFYDHFDPDKEKAKRPSPWRIQVREPKDAAEIARILTEAVA